MCGGVLRFLNLLINRAGVRACPTSAFIRALSSVNGHVKLAVLSLERVIHSCD